MTLANTSATNEYAVIVATRGSEDDRRFLMVRHKERGWELPGGKFEANEGPVHCALREFREETGHLLAEPKFVLKVDKEGGTCYVFTGRLGAAVDNPTDDIIDGMEWFDRLPDALAFPDDPYDEMGAALSLSFR